MGLEYGLVLRSTTNEAPLALSFGIFLVPLSFYPFSFCPLTFLSVSVSLYLLSGKNGQLSTPRSSMTLKETNAEAT